MYQSKAEVQLRKSLSIRGEVEGFITQPLTQHILLISIYFPAWRDYLLLYEEELLAIVRPNNNSNHILLLSYLPNSN
jgi:hypothetical protein